MEMVELPWYPLRINPHRNTTGKVRGILRAIGSFPRTNSERERQRSVDDDLAAMRRILSASIGRITRTTGTVDTGMKNFAP
jgi:hypothetical protein